MAITQSMCTSFKQELMNALHNLAAGGNLFKMALYDSTATLGPSTTAYGAANEANGSGYTAGGANLTNSGLGNSGNTAWASFANLTFSNVSITARGALIYNATNNNRAVACFDFGANYTATAGNFTVTMPVADANTAVLRIAGP